LNPIAPTTWLLIVLPFVAPAVAFLSAANWVGEPFGSLELRDILLFGGAPLVVLAVSTMWYVLARRRRLPWLVIISVLAWFALMLYWAVDSLVPYFSEPWNTDFGPG
jgi:hypothetical protein